MRRPARRFGILVLALALIPGQFSTADAGLIPWVYDAIFGPVGHYGYGGYGYGASYGYPYAGSQVSYVVPSAPVYYRQSNCGPTGCGPSGCSTSSYVVGYRPLFSSPGFCSTGGCSTVVSGYRYAGANCGTCSTVASANSTCNAKTAWKSKDAQTEWKAEVIRGEAAVPTPATQDEAPRPKTFAEEAEAQPMAVEKVVAGDAGKSAKADTPAEADPNWTKTGKPAASVADDKSADGAKPSTGTAGFGETLREGETGVTEAFSEPVKGDSSSVDGDAVPAKTPTLPEGLEGTPTPEVSPSLDINLPLDLENKTSWKLDVPVQRVAFRAGFGRARLARTSVDVKVDYVVPTTAVLPLVSR